MQILCEPTGIIFAYIEVATVNLRDPIECDSAIVQLRCTTCPHGLRAKELRRRGEGIVDIYIHIHECINSAL